MGRIDLTEELLTLLAKVPDHRETAKQAGVTGDWFIEPNHKRIWDLLQASNGCLSENYLHSQGGVDFDFVEYSDDPHTLVEALREAIVKDEITQLCGDASTSSHSSDRILRALVKGLGDLVKFKRPDSLSPLFLQDLQTLYAAYLERKVSKGITGLSWPFPTINKLTTGINQGDWDLIYGHGKAMKTWLWLLTAYNVWMKDEASILLTSKEMGESVCRERFAAIHSKVDYGRYRQGCLLDYEEARFQDGLTFIEERGKNVPIFWRETDKLGPEAVQEVQTWANELDVEAVFFDCVEGLGIDWKEHTASARAIKAAAKKNGTPWIGTTQANRSLNRRKPNTDPEHDIGGSLTFLQSVDQLLRTTKVKPAQLQITMAAMREAKEEIVQLRAVPAVCFEEIACEEMDVAEEPEFL